MELETDLLDQMLMLLRELKLVTLIWKKNHSRQLQIIAIKYELQALTLTVYLENKRERNQLTFPIRQRK